MVKRQRRKQTLEDVIYHWKKPYLSIIFLTLQYQDKFKDKKDGFRLIHYRYALVKNHNITSTTGQLSIKAIKKFFGGKLRTLYDFKDIEKCITTTNNLSKYLNNLVEMGALHKDSDEKEKLATYRINPENYKKIERTMKLTLIRKIAKEYPEIIEDYFDQIGQSLVDKLQKQDKTHEANVIQLNLSVFNKFSDK